MTAPPPADAPFSYGVSYVCTGNICRSPIGEALLRARIIERGWSDRVFVESAATMQWHRDKPADPRTLEVLTRYGHDASSHRSRPFIASDWEHLDLILALDADHQRMLRILAPSQADADKVRLLRSFDPAAVAAGTLSVDDPFNDGPDGFERVYREISTATDGVVAHIAQVLAAHPSPAHPSPAQP